MKRLVSRNWRVQTKLDRLLMDSLDAYFCPITQIPGVSPQVVK